MRDLGANLILGKSEPPHPPISPAGERVRERGKPGIGAFGKLQIILL